MLTNLQLVQFAERAVALGAKYWYGTCWYDSSESLLTRKAKQYPPHYTSGRMPTYRKHIAEKCMVCDCVGLIKGFFWTNGGTGPNKYKSNNCPDTSANGMIALCPETWPISKMPDTPGLVLWKNGHIGINIGGGKAIEARGFEHGVVLTAVSARGWSKAGRLPASMMTYVDMEQDDTPVLSYGTKNDAVRRMQRLLLEHNPACLLKWGADGDFGSETHAALEAFQKAVGLAVTGVCDDDTWAALAKVTEDTQEPETPININPYAMPTKNMARGSKGEGVKWIQFELINAGLSCGVDGIDGDFGQNTEAAVLRFQELVFPGEQKEWDSVVGPKTRDKLIAVTGDVLSAEA